MKKVLCLILSVIMALSCLGVAASAANPYVNFTELSAMTGDKSDIEALMVEGGTLDGFNYYGLTPDFLYYSTDHLNWGKLNISWSDVALMKGNFNTYLSRVFQERFSRTTLYCGKYATAICNFIGHLFFAHFVDKTITFDDDFAQIDEFYEVICEQSGLTQLFTEKLCPYYPELNYSPFLVSFGVNLNDLPAPERDIANGKLVAELLVKSVVNGAISQGPLNYIISVFRNFCEEYSLFLRQPIKALFSDKIAAGYITADELDTFKGLFNLVFNDNNQNDTSKIWFLTPPVTRFALAEDETELFLYLMAYLRIVGMYKTNVSAVTAVQNKVNASTTFDSTEKSRINTMIGIAFKGETPENIEAFLTELNDENMDEVKNAVWYDFSTFFDRILESIAQFFDRIFSFFDRIFN